MICPEYDYRDGLSDQEFWDRTIASLDAMRDQDYYDGPEPDLFPISGEPCPECGESGPCGYDSEGRPMIHIVSEDEQS